MKFAMGIALFSLAAIGCGGSHAQGTSRSSMYDKAYMQRVQASAQMFTRVYWVRPPLKAQRQGVIKKGEQKRAIADRAQARR